MPREVGKTVRDLVLERPPLEFSRNLELITVVEGISRLPRHAVTQG